MRRDDLFHHDAAPYELAVARLKVCGTWPELLAQAAKRWLSKESQFERTREEAESLFRPAKDTRRRVERRRRAIRAIARSLCVHPREGPPLPSSRTRASGRRAGSAAAPPRGQPRE